MKKGGASVWAIIIILIILGLLVYVVLKNNKQKVNQVTANQEQIQSTNTKQLFADSDYAQNAYLISTPTLDTNTQKALTGFKITKKVLADGSTEIVLDSQNTEYVSQSYVVKPGEKLYFIETNLSDDNKNEDKFIGDDTAILVDSEGYIVNK